MASGFTEVARTDYAGNGYDRDFDQLLVNYPVLCYILFDIAKTSGIYGIDTQVLGNATILQAILSAINTTNAARGGVFYPFSTVTMSDIRDGTSNTYLCGEKYVSMDNYENGEMNGDQWNLYIGYDPDIVRFSARGDLSTVAQDSTEVNLKTIWGSAHASGFNMAFCDGSVHMIHYGIDPVVHDHLGNRQDGQVIDGNALSQ